MPSLNRVEIIASLGKDHETRYTPSGKKFCSFSVAVSHRRKVSDGETKETTDWFIVDTWGRLAEVCQSYPQQREVSFH